MKKKIITSSTFTANFILNSEMPRSIQSKDRTYTCHRDTDKHKKGDVVTIKAKDPKDVPFSIPGVEYILTKNKIKFFALDSKHFCIQSDDMKSLNEVIDKVIGNKEKNIDGLLHDKQVKSVVRVTKNDCKYVNVTKDENSNEVETDWVKKPKKPSANKTMHKSEEWKKNKATLKHQRKQKFVKKDATALNVSKTPRKAKKAKETASIQYTLGMLNDMNDTHITKAQLKRAKIRIALIEFVNAICDKDFKTYNETMKFIRDYKNENGIQKLAA